MSVFKVQQGKLAVIKEFGFKLEKEIQQLFENNLEEILGLEFLRTEFQVNGLRIDSLAFDTQTNSFVIIEYKRERNFSVIDQGYAYLALLLNNRADFILEHQDHAKKKLDRKQFDWSQSKVIFVSPSFTKFQREAINFKDLPIELWTARRYEGGIINIEQLTSNGKAASVKTLSNKNSEIENITKEIKTYSEDDHLNGIPAETVELYERYRASILDLADDIDVKPKKMEIGFKKSKIFCDITIQKKSLKLWINLKKGELDDPKDITRDVSATGHWGNGDYEIQVSNDKYLEYIMSLIKQAIKA